VEVEGLSAGTQFTCCVVGLALFVPVIAFVVGAVRGAVAQHGYVPLGDAVFIGSFSVIIFVVDLVILTTIRGTGSILRTVFLAAFRIGLAVVMAWNISQPLVIARFNDHIDVELAARRERDVERTRANIRAREAEIVTQNAPGIAALEQAVLGIDAARQRLHSEREQTDREIAKAREEYTREITGRNPSRAWREGPIGRSLRTNVLEPAEAHLRKLDLQDEQLQAERAKMIDRIRELRQAAAASPRLANLQQELADAIAKLENAPPVGIALRADVLEDLWRKNGALRREVWMFLLWLVLLDITPVWAKILAPIRSLDRARAQRDFREQTDTAVEREVYPDVARDVIGTQHREFLFLKMLESELAKQGHCLRGTLATLDNLIEIRRRGLEKITAAYGAEGISSPEGQESLGVVEATCSSMADAYTAFLRRENMEARA
jgi:Domain of unknown function (DUF4407)